MMAVAAAWEPWALKDFTSSGMPAWMGSMGSTWPMTPVEATTTSWGSMPRAWAAKSHMVWAFSTPSALQVLALPELQMTALAAPSAMFFRVTRMGAPFTRFWVYTAAAAQGFSL